MGRKAVEFQHLPGNVPTNEGLLARKPLILLGKNGAEWRILTYMIYIYIYTYVDKYNVNIWVKLWHMACYVSSSISWVHKYITYIYMNIYIYKYITCV